MQVELVSVETADDVRLDGSLRRPASTAPGLGVDLVICHHGVGGRFYGPSFFDRVGDRLLERGCAVLRVNNRGHDSVYNRGGMSASYAATQAERLAGGPLGAACEIVDDCRLDWQAWLDLAEALGFRRIALWGHSLGAVKTLYYLAREADSRVLCAIASSPPRFNYELYAGSEHGLQFREALEQASALVAAGKGDDFLRVTFPTIGVFSARTYVDKYGPEARYDIFEHIPGVSVPLMLTLGELETAVNFRDLAARGPSLGDSLPGVRFRSIAGADHAYSGRVEELWSEVSDWLSSLRVAMAARWSTAAPGLMPSSRRAKNGLGRC